MSRYTGPRLKVMRALGAQLPGLSRKSIEERLYPPGQHGQSRSKRRTDFATKLMEKQKLRYNYGLSERQMRRLLMEARRAEGGTGDRLLALLERRLDNVVFRAGYAPTIMAARQLVNHNHVLLNGRTASVASIQVKPGDVIALKERAIGIPMVVDSLASPALEIPEWIEFDETSKQARVTRNPLPDEVPLPIEVYRVVEFYSNRL
jgi:small subunit ribosomal protein S4